MQFLEREAAVADQRKCQVTIGMEPDSETRRSHTLMQEVGGFVVAEKEEAEDFQIPVAVSAVKTGTESSVAALDIDHAGCAIKQIIRTLILRQFYVIQEGCAS